MKAKKIIKGILGLGVVSGVAYLAYKIGEGNGEINERFRDKYDDDEEDFNFYDYDEPDDGCITHADRSKSACTMEDLKDMTSVEESSSEQKNHFAPLNSITTVSAKSIRNLRFTVFQESTSLISLSEIILMWIVTRRQRYWLNFSRQATSVMKRVTTDTL